MRRLRACFPMLCCLTACTTLPERGRQAVLGHSRAELVACAGVPDQEESRDGQEVLVWKIERASSGALTLPAPLDISLSFNKTAACHVVATVRDGEVRQFVYTGPAQTWEGKDAACAPIIRGCIP
ncbi:hypothetical protein AA0472_2058 [Acetobacter estunensis NRIC 0472]|uniref:Uncharacterized protein n=1 Tax=Acetobacter estunensis TaxID=104097 RepID=A0A967B2J5_9PROT|nr:hypothetical protein [Acetobacter estunensis]NHO52542.1 hypothetical protein [Acetobacter estunensis]GBQ26270.1 hypothetical protein AA0472_2058 [Acetobacter estunensis NRIC 0472]